LFDTQILRLPAEAAVPAIVSYYGNATIGAYPLNRLIALVMIATAGGALYQLLRGRIPRSLAGAAAAFSSIAVGLALTRIVPNAMRLGSGGGSLTEHAALARSICYDHLLCLALMVGFIAVEVASTRR
jgi:hypothetical protein